MADETHRDVSRLSQQNRSAAQGLPSPYPLPQAGEGEKQMDPGFRRDDGAEAFRTDDARGRVRRNKTGARQRRLSRRAIPPAHPARRHDQLPQLIAPRTKYRRRSGEIEPPHAPEPLAIRGRKRIPRAIEVRAPRHQRAVVVGAEIVKMGARSESRRKCVFCNLPRRLFSKRTLRD